MSRYSPLSREIAAVICSIAACDSSRPFYSSIAADLGLCETDESYPPCLRLALDAWMEATTAEARATGRDAFGAWTADVDAEAEALIRTGWVPS